ncbi:MAG: hypothetical protein NT070_14560, partial [Cyanobacteria bacterium]|nr:hypothetical protein [Cyanobacteriota bacterium]
MEIEREFTQTQRSNSFESTSQDLSIQPPSNIDIQSKLESESFDQNSSLIQRYQEIPPSSQSNSSEAIEPANQTIEQRIQRLSVPEDSEDSSIVQRQIDSFQPEQQSLDSSIEIDQQSIQIQPTPIKPSNPPESLTQDLSIQSASTLDVPFKLESESFDQPSSLIQRYPEAVTSSQTNLEEAIEPANQTIERQIQIVSVPEDSNVVQRQVDSFQPEQQSLGSSIEIDRQSIQIQPTPIQPSNSPESLTQDSSIQSASTVDIPFKLESESFDQPSSLIQRYPEAVTS